MMGEGGKVERWFIDVSVWMGGQWVGIIFLSVFCLVFVLLLIVFSWLVHDSCCVYFIVPFFLSLSLVPFN